MTATPKHFNRTKPRMNAHILRKGGVHRSSRKAERRRAKQALAHFSDDGDRGDELRET